MFNMIQNTRDYSQMLDDFFRPFVTAPMSRMKVDIEDKGDCYELSTDLPGISKDDLKVDIENGVMTVTANVNSETNTEERNYVCRERRAYSMSRSFNLEGIDEGGITAQLQDGVLKMTLPKATNDGDRVRHIEIA